MWWWSGLDCGLIIFSATPAINKRSNPNPKSLFFVIDRLRFTVVNEALMFDAIVKCDDAGVIHN